MALRPLKVLNRALKIYETAATRAEIRKIRFAGIAAAPA
jgi:hypothetical protein